MGQLALKISIVLPSNRTSDAALARIFELGSLDPARFEVIVRDNSGNARKRQALESIEGSAVKPIFAAGAGPFENVIESVRAATGDYIFPFADDDWLFARGLASLYELASEQLADAECIRHYRRISGGIIKRLRPIQLRRYCRGTAARSIAVIPKCQCRELSLLLGTEGQRCAFLLRFLGSRSRAFLLSRPAVVVKLPGAWRHTAHSAVAVLL